jgi:single-stranded-DNA-specific exonuclease
LYANPQDLIQKLLASRGANASDTLDLNTVAYPTGPHGFKGMNTASRLLADAILQRATVTIVGDYDVDGSSATAILATGLRNLMPVYTLIPNRVTDGYGLSPSIASRITPDTQMVITVDNGISAHAGVEAVKARGMKIIVTDHHLAGDTLPTPDALVNPNQPECPFPWKGTCGAGVAWYLLWATQMELDRQGCSRQGYPQVAQAIPVWNQLDLVALATVADVVPMERNNRVLVQAGLQQICAGQARPGVNALIAVAKKEVIHITSTDFGFALGPRLNAAGRMADMQTGIRLLMTGNPYEADALARELDAMNQNRRAVEEQMRIEADAIAQSLIHSMGGQVPRVICLGGTAWHEGVVGIVASRLKEQYQRPTFIFAQSAEGLIKGSGRSIEGFHLRDALALVEARNPGLIAHFGGHAMAAGLSMPIDHFEVFTREINAACPVLQQQVTQMDGSLVEYGCGLEVARAIEQAGPWGQGFALPVFEDAFQVVEARALKNGHWRLKLATGMLPAGTHPAGDATVTAVYFLKGGEREAIPAPPAKGSMLQAQYQLQVNRWNGAEEAQILIQAVVGIAPPRLAQGRVDGIGFGRR